MIDKNDLMEILKKYEFTEEQINRTTKSKTLLKRGNEEKIEKNLEVLVYNHIPLEKISRSTAVFFKNDYLEIEKIFKVLDKHKISKETIENCLYVFVSVKGKAKEIEKIFEILYEHNISKETIENCLSVLAIGKAKEIEERFNVLDEHKISKEKIEENYGVIFLKNLNEFNKIFSRLPEDSDTENIIMYMKLKGYYNKIVTKEEINKICEFKNINIEKIITLYLKQGNIADYKKILEEKGGLYIGKSIPMNKQDMNKYGNIILDISKKISNLMSFRYKYDKQDLESFCVSTLIEKCGDVVYNTDINQEFMYRALYNKTKKYCIGYILEQKDNYNIDFSKLQNTTKTSVYDKNSFEKDELDVKQWNLKSKDEEIIKKLSNYLEMGYDNKIAFKNTAKDLDLDIEELIYNIEEIKNQILNENKDSDEQKKEERE